MESLVGTEKMEKIMSVCVSVYLPGYKWVSLVSYC